MSVQVHDLVKFRAQEAAQLASISSLLERDWTTFLTRLASVLPSIGNGERRHKLSQTLPLKKVTENRLKVSIMKATKQLE